MKTTVLCVAPFNNPHIMPMYDSMSREADIDFIGVCLKPLAPERIELGWPEIAFDSIFLQPWRRKGDRRRYYEELLRADVVVMPGFFHNRTLPFQHWIRRLTGKPTLLWSEPFIDHPRSTPLNVLTKKILVKPCNSTTYHLLTMGSAALADYRSIGANRWSGWQFAFSVAPQAEVVRAPQPKDGRVRFVFVGALVERKGIDTLLQAAHSLSKAGLDYSLSLVGGGPLHEHATSFVRRHGLEELVSLVGSVPLDQVGARISGADVLVLPSIFDGWGAVINEAMELGTACIASTAVNSAEQLVVSGQTGLLFPHGDATALTAAMARLIDDTDLLTAMKRQSREAIQAYRPAAAASRLAALCRGLAGHADMPRFDTGLCTRWPES